MVGRDRPNTQAVPPLGRAVHLLDITLGLAPRHATADSSGIYLWPVADASSRPMGEDGPE
jgi:hypothetical protein